VGSLLLVFLFRPQHNVVQCRPISCSLHRAQRTDWSIYSSHCVSTLT